MGTSIDLSSWGTGAISYAGSPALFNNWSDGTTTLTKVGGGSFSFLGIDLSELFNNMSVAPFSIEFTAQKTGGGAATATVTLDGVFGFETFSFGATFLSIDSLSWVQRAPFHQFDNIVVESVDANVPEPVSLLLLGAGIIGAGAHRYRRRRA